MRGPGVPHSLASSAPGLLLPMLLTGSRIRTGKLGVPPRVCHFRHSSHNLRFIPRGRIPHPAPALPEDRRNNPRPTLPAAASVPAELHWERRSRHHCRGHHCHSCLIIDGRPFPIPMSHAPDRLESGKSSQLNPVFMFLPFSFWIYWASACPCPVSSQLWMVLSFYRTRSRPPFRWLLRRRHSARPWN
jgi:hypothetical protein